MVTDAELRKLLKDNPPGRQFVPYSYLSHEADALTVYFEGDADYSKRLNDYITLYLSIQTDEIVGCRIKGISGILKDLPNYIRVNHNGVEDNAVFLEIATASRYAQTRLPYIRTRGQLRQLLAALGWRGEVKGEG